MKKVPLLCGFVLIWAVSISPSLVEADAPSKFTTPLVVEGQILPPLRIMDASGQPHQSVLLKGKRALLVTFFPKCFTGNCTSQLTSLRDSYPALQKAGVEVWAISTDTADGPKGQRAFSKHLKLPFPLFPDPTRKLCLLFGAVQTKEQMAARMSVLVDKQGIVRSIDKQIGLRTHGVDVLAAVRRWETNSVVTPKQITPRL